MTAGVEREVLVAVVEVVEVNEFDRMNAIAGSGAGIAAGIAGGLELAGATADATGVLAPIGVGVQALGAVAGATALVAGGIGDIIDDVKSNKQDALAKAKAVGEKAPALINSVAKQATGLTGSYVGQDSTALESRGAGTSAF